MKGLTKPTPPKRPIAPYKTILGKSKVIEVYDGMSLNQLVNEFSDIEDKSQIRASLNVEYGYYDSHSAECFFKFQGKSTENQNYKEELAKYKKDLKEYNVSLKEYQDNLALYNAQVQEQKLKKQYEKLKKKFG